AVKIFLLLQKTLYDLSHQVSATYVFSRSTKIYGVDLEKPRKIYWNYIVFWFYHAAAHATSLEQ
ncbi:MAG: hypothetical protein D3916_00400, partial [Candidatus Electrothrix sp. MAN1_4]|nr:hypothetical protein [Candidatus Electrothrix sp. MAN1_4]